MTYEPSAVGKLSLFTFTFVVAGVRNRSTTGTIIVVAKNSKTMSTVRRPRIASNGGGRAEAEFKTMSAVRRPRIASNGGGRAEAEFKTMSAVRRPRIASNGGGRAEAEFKTMSAVRRPRIASNGGGRAEAEFKTMSAVRRPRIASNGGGRAEAEFKKVILLLLLLSTSHSILYSCQCPRTGDEGRKPTTAKQKAKTKSKKIK